ncbi:hypothetical protein [Clostridium magnum]|uniref:Head decoration protein n=1 Tax=Clostridium magnum DSM 2767 TaxID=1121326 RepID=A0A162QMA9_9CLOT|nr:hypothetical protein [Clostridium magnum]KZL88707.1 hypothetical protein CLMAG_59960 [Clostridium magnum DSM 2767]SHJ44369.1 hypothetical protein SAMN02745944_05974 [Clostridium magnum DSM 2767]
MSQAFSQIGTFTPDNLIAGNQVPLLTKAIELEIGTGTLKRGSLISIAGKLANSTTTGVEPDTTTTYDIVEGILTDDVTLSSSSKTNATVYISGEFNSTYMTTGVDTTVSDFERELRMLGIYVK